VSPVCPEGLRRCADEMGRDSIEVVDYAQYD
jgi:hypothetical protein